MSKLRIILPNVIPDWQDGAPCAEIDPELFYPLKGANAGPAKSICAGCDVQQKCLEYALANNEQYGIWGGATEDERRALAAAGPTAPPMGCATCGRLRRNHTTRDHTWQSPSMEAIDARAATLKTRRAAA